MTSAAGDPAAAGAEPMSPQTHWDAVWSTKHFDEVSWYQADSPRCSGLIRSLATPSEQIAIMGAGASSLVIDLVRHGYAAVHAVDLSDAALDQLRTRLGDDAPRVTYHVADVRSIRFEVPIDLWHDRATFHFLTDPADQARYAQGAADAVRPNGHLILATFSHDGPEQCSGLPVVRYRADTVVQRFGASFELLDSFNEDHLTPWGATQSFIHCILRRRSTAADTR